MEKFGFIYVWFDRKHKKFYVGRHWGTEEDGYICSSNKMRMNYKNRPEDFKRRIVARVQTKEQLVTEEQRWLDMIKPWKLKGFYYNVSLNATTATMRGRKHSAETKAKMSAKAAMRNHSDETRQKIRQIRTGKKHRPESIEKIRINSHTARDYSDPVFRQKMSSAAKNRSSTTRQKISENNKRLQAEGKIGMAGKKHSAETISKMTASQRRIATSRIGKTLSEERKDKVAKTGTLLLLLALKAL